MELSSSPYPQNIVFSFTALSDDGFTRVLAFLEYKFLRRSKVYLKADNTRWHA
jgi:hypothetical protein